MREPTVIEENVEVENWKATATFKRIFITKVEKKAQGGEKNASIPIKIRNIAIFCKRSNAEFKFPLTVRGGVATFGDSRQNNSAYIVKPRLTPSEMRGVLSVWLGKDNADKLMNVVLS